VFVKKTQQTPNREIELALKRAKEISQSQDLHKRSMTNKEYRETYDDLAMSLVRLGIPCAGVVPFLRDLA
jgi:hypothetical protein